MPYWRLSAFYLFYFASLGALLPYWALYLKHLGFGPQQIGELMAVLMATKIIAPNLWGWVADRTGKRMTVVRIGSLLAVVAFIGVFVSRDFWTLAIAMFVFSFFWNAVLPQFEATTLTHLGAGGTHEYSRIRLWGSVGFIIAVAGLGPVLDRAGAGILPYVVVSLYGAIWLSSLVVPAAGSMGEAHTGESLGTTLRRPAVMALVIASFLMQASHGPYYTFYTIFMEDFGYSRGAIGQLWALGVVAEVIVFLFMGRLLIRYGLRVLLLASLWLTTGRWVLTGLFPEQLPVMIFAQTLHAASFGVFHAVAIALFHRYFRGRHHGKGQALYSSLSFGAGGAVGSYYSGMAWESIGPSATFLVAGGLSALGALAAWGWIKPEEAGSPATGPGGQAGNASRSE
jgi:PPP family 3-phenylpropionic acid transporter